MFQRYNGGNMDEGWTRLMFEQFDVPFKSLMDAELRKGDLNATFDVIVLPADSVAAMTGEAGAAAGAGGRGGRGGGGAAPAVKGAAAVAARVAAAAPRRSTAAGSAPKA